MWYSNNVPALANHFTHHLLEQFSNRLFKQIQSVSKSEIHICSTAIRISCRSVSFDWRVHQTHSNKNRICSDNWSNCNARISMVKARTLYEYQLEIARSNIACKRVFNFHVPFKTSCELAGSFKIKMQLYKLLFKGIDTFRSFS